MTREICSVDARLCSPHASVRPWLTLVGSPSAMLRSMNTMLLCNRQKVVLAERDVALREPKRGVVESKLAVVERERFNHGREVGWR